MTAIGIRTGAIAFNKRDLPCNWKQCGGLKYIDVCTNDPFSSIGGLYDIRVISQNKINLPGPNDAYRQIAIHRDTDVSRLK